MPAIQASIHICHASSQLSYPWRAAGGGCQGYLVFRKQRLLSTEEFDQDYTWARDKIARDSLDFKTRRSRDCLET